MGVTRVTWYGGKVSMDVSFATFSFDSQFKIFWQKLFRWKTTWSAFVGFCRQGVHQCPQLSLGAWETLSHLHPRWRSHIEARALGWTTTRRVHLQWWCSHRYDPTDSWLCVDWLEPTSDISSNEFFQFLFLTQIQNRKLLMSMELYCFLCFSWNFAFCFILRIHSSYKDWPRKLRTFVMFFYFSDFSFDTGSM